MTQTYNILLTGQINEGVDKAQAIDAFAKASGISAEKAQELFANAPSVIKKNVDEATAKSYQDKLNSLGIQTELKPSTDYLASADADRPITPNTAKKQTIRFSFSGNGYEYFKIWIVNILLVIITLGLYSPWAKVRNTQYFYGNTTLNGTSFSFTADPVKMLIGRLIALGLFIAYAGINAVAPIASALLGIGFIFIIPWVINKSMAFYARNTTYRNIRFRFQGSYWDAFKTFILWPMAGTLTLMILMPLAIYKQQMYVINNHNYGNKSFAFWATPGAFYKMCFMAFGIGIVGAILGWALSQAIPGLGFVGIALGYIGAIIYFMVSINNITFNNTCLADHDFKANYEVLSFGWIMLSNFVLAVVTLGLYIPWAKVRLAHYAAEHTAIDANGDLDEFIAITQEDPSAFGEEFGDVFDINVGF